MFSQISGRYDLMNSLMTFGLDQTWRRTLIDMVQLPPGARLLDVGAGTGKIALEAVRREPRSRVVAVDFSYEMLSNGKERARRDRPIVWCCADALHLPFPDATFNALTSGYLVRNVSDIDQAFQEQIRVIKPGGRVACLETSPPPRNPVRPLVLLYFKWIIPRLGHVITGCRQAYEYLPETTRRFKSVEELAGIMGRAGLEEVRFKRFMFGTINVLVGRRPIS